MIHVAHVTASPCPDKDLLQRLASAMHSRDRRSIKWRGKEKMAEKRGGEGVGGVGEDVILAIEKSIVGIGNAVENAAARPIPL